MNQILKEKIETEMKYDKDPMLTEDEVQTVAILGLEGIKVNAYNIYLARLVKQKKITVSQSGHAAIEYETKGIKKY